MKLHFPIRYLPTVLTKKDKKLQVKMLIKSKKLYKNNKYYTRKQLPSYKNKKSKHILNARKIYNIKNITPNKELARKTGCKLSALNKIVSTTVANSNQFSLFFIPLNLHRCKHLFIFI